MNKNRTTIEWRSLWRSKRLQGILFIAKPQTPRVPDIARALFIFQPFIWKIHKICWVQYAEYKSCHWRQQGCIIGPPQKEKMCVVFASRLFAAENSCMCLQGLRLARPRNYDFDGFPLVVVVVLFPPQPDKIHGGKLVDVWKGDMLFVPLGNVSRQLPFVFRFFFNMPFITRLTFSAR